MALVLVLRALVGGYYFLKKDNLHWKVILGPKLRFEEIIIKKES